MAPSLAARLDRVILFVVAFLLLAVGSFWGLPSGKAVAGALVILDGGVPYRDFWTMYTPRPVLRGCGALRVVRPRAVCAGHSGLSRSRRGCSFLPPPPVPAGCRPVVGAWSLNRFRSDVLEDRSGIDRLCAGAAVPAPRVESHRRLFRDGRSRASQMGRGVARCGSVLQARRRRIYRRRRHRQPVRVLAAGETATSCYVVASGASDACRRHCCSRDDRAALDRDSVDSGVGRVERPLRLSFCSLPQGSRRSVSRCDSGSVACVRLALATSSCGRGAGGCTGACSVGGPTWPGGGVSRRGRRPARHLPARRTRPHRPIAAVAWRHAIFLDRRSCAAQYPPLYACGSGCRYWRDRLVTFRRSD